MSKYQMQKLDIKPSPYVIELQQTRYYNGDIILVDEQGHRMTQTRCGKSIYPFYRSMDSAAAVADLIGCYVCFKGEIFKPMFDGPNPLIHRPRKNKVA